MNNKLIPILTVISHYMVFLYQYEWQYYEWQYVGYTLWVKPDRIWVSMEVTNIFCVSYSCIEADMEILSTKSISDVWQIFDID